MSFQFVNIIVNFRSQIPLPTRNPSSVKSVRGSVVLLQTMLLVLALFLVGPASGKVYERCELARELRDVHEAASHQLATWVCIAEHESQYNTSAVGHLSGDGSGDHGIFQVIKDGRCLRQQVACSTPTQLVDLYRSATCTGVLRLAKAGHVACRAPS